MAHHRGHRRLARVRGFDVSLVLVKQAGRHEGVPNILRQATQWMENKPRAPEPASAASPAPEVALGQLLQQGDWAILPADGPSLPFLDTSPLTHHVEGDRKPLS